MITEDPSVATLLRALDIIQNQALRVCTGAFRTSPISSLHADTYRNSASHAPPQLSRPSKIKRDIKHVNHYHTLVQYHIDLTPDNDVLPLRLTKLNTLNQIRHCLPNRQNDIVM